MISYFGTKSKRGESTRLRSDRGFTVIELLIVIAIILILIAIALPNFLEAQVRAKLAKVKGEFRTLNTALQEYQLDFNDFPPVVDHFSTPFLVRLRPLTTPVKYLTDMPRDPFVRLDGKYGGPEEQSPYPGNIYMYNTGAANFGEGVTDPNSRLQERFSLHSGGPDGVIDFPYYAFSENFILQQRHLVFVYSPTNGTRSAGDIIQRGGEIPNPLPGFGS
ncbi:MAG: prepilin-type N-terminal cleavage/methylation domain-containing protein [Candidatus Omnitrophica bacterium]|nr:prepilin-type N-terminal cleavage/methylation domain-containing protein [Candidatus Omnitrophota bacterium]